jgi:phospholipase C
MGLKNIEHIIVVMLENRSFDNVLGALYPSGPDFDGVGNTCLPNLWNGKEYWPQHGTDLTQPNPDPNEKFQFVHHQMFNCELIIDRDGRAAAPPPPAPTMQGFVADYATAPKMPSEPTALEAQARVIMNHFEPADVPIISTLARSYAVCDQWFAPAPTQTLCNRSFAVAGTSSGWVNNQWGGLFDFHLLINETTTIFNLLEENGVPWRVYYGGPLFLCNALIGQRKLDPYALTRFSAMHDFYEDVKGDAKSFPSYVWIEPNFIGNFIYGPETDEHPQANPLDFEGPSNVMHGEKLLRDIFSAITANTDLWNSTLLVILFDEHGGTFDHVPPPNAIPPDDKVISGNDQGGYGFTFDRYGVRVPALLVSPWIADGTIAHTTFDHTSLLATVMNRFLGGVTDALGKRVPAATDLSALIGDTLRVDIPTLPSINLGTVPFDATTIVDVPLTDYQRDLLLLGAKRMAELIPTALIDVAAELLTHGHAANIIGAMSDAERRQRG